MSLSTSPARGHPASGQHNDAGLAATFNNTPSSNSNNNNTGTATPSTPSKKQSGFSAHVSNLRDATSSSAQNFIADLIATSLPSTSVDGAKSSLSLRTTTLQFTRFVHKTGPVFAVQDALESVFRWQDPVLTLLVACGWALVCLYPQLLLLLPSAALTTVLLYNHSRRFPPEPISLDNPYQESHTVKPPPSGQPPTEGSVDYLQNMQNIQELMGRVADLTDAGRQIVPYFNWSDYHFSLVLLQISSASFIFISILLVFFRNRLDMRYVFLLMGEGALLASHQLSLSITKDLSSSPTAKLRLHKLKALLVQVLKDDALSDEIILPNKQGEYRVVKEIVVFENERRSLDGSWSTDVLRLEDWKPWQVLLDGEEHISKASSLSSSRGNGNKEDHQNAESPVYNNDEPVKFETITPPRGYIWIPEEDWQIDKLGLWTAQSFSTGAGPNSGRPACVDAEGWASVDADGRLLNPPATLDGSVSGAAMRKRKWFRRIVSSPTYS